MGAKRLRHRGGVSWLTRKENPAGEWSLRVEPENILIDTYHPGGEPHVHDPRPHGRRIGLGRLSAEETTASCSATSRSTGACVSRSS